MSRQYSTSPCPVCGEPSRVIYARERDDGTFRKRECTDPECGLKYTTLEAVLGGRRLQNAIPVTSLVEFAELCGISVRPDR